MYGSLYIYQYFFVPGRKFVIHFIIIGIIFAIIFVLERVVSENDMNLYGGILILILMLYIWKMNRDIDNKKQKS